MPDIEVPVPGGIRGLVALPDGTVYATSPGNGGVYPITVTPTAMTLGTFIPTDPQAWGIAYNAARERIYVGNTGPSPSISAVDIATQAEVEQQPLPCGPRDLDTSPDGNHVFAACLAGGAYAFSYLTGATTVLPIAGMVEGGAVAGPAGADSTRIYVTRAANPINQVLFMDQPVVAGPAGATVQVGSAVVLTADVDGYWETVQWQVLAPGSATWTDVPGATDVTLSVTPTLAQSGTQYRLVARSGFFEDVLGVPAVVTVTPTPVPTPTPTSPPGACPTPPAPCLAVTGAEATSGAGVAAALVTLGAALVVASGAAARRRR